MKTLVLYYSRTCSNDYLAHRFAQALEADIEAIKPRIKAFPFLIVASLLKLKTGIRKLDHNPDQYDRVILVGPIWMGQLIAPLRDTLFAVRKLVRSIHFATCCGGGDDMKDDPFGYEQVFKRVRKIGAERVQSCTAFPIVLVIPEGKRDDGDYVMKTRLDDANFQGEILDRFNALIEQLKTENP